MSQRQTETEMQKDRKRETHRFPLGRADRGDARERRGRIGEKSWREKSEGGRWQALGKSGGSLGSGLALAPPCNSHSMSPFLQTRDWA